MSPEQITWAVLIAAQAVVNAPVILHRFFPRKDLDMVIPGIQSLLDQIPAAVKQAIDTAVANAPLPAGAASAQDVADTTAAVQAVVQAIPSTQG